MKRPPSFALLAMLCLAPASLASSLVDQTAPFVQTEQNGVDTLPAFDAPLAPFSTLRFHAYIEDPGRGPTDDGRLLDAEGDLLLRVWHSGSYRLSITDASSPTGQVVLDKVFDVWARILVVPVSPGVFDVTLDDRAAARVTALKATTPARLVTEPGASEAHYYGPFLDDPRDIVAFWSPLSTMPGWSAHGADAKVRTAGGGHFDIGHVEILGSSAEGRVTYVQYAPPSVPEHYRVGAALKPNAADPLGLPSGQSVIACLDAAGALVWSVDVVTAPAGWGLAYRTPGSLAARASPTYITPDWHDVEARLDGEGLTLLFDERHAWRAPEAPATPCASFAMGDLEASDGLHAGADRTNAGAQAARYDDFFLQSI